MKDTLSVYVKRTPITGSLQTLEVGSTFVQYSESKKQKNMKKAADRLRQRIKNLTMEAHHKTAKWLCTNFGTIFIPSFGVKKRTNKQNRKIGKPTIRKMLCWSHYAFRQRLIQCAQKTKNTNIVECDEAYTSKTCGRCGWQNAKLGGKKTFKCQSCQLVIGRDIHGARNSMLRALGVPPLSDGDMRFLLS